MEERRRDEFSERLVRLEEQVKRLVSHLESERGTQQRVADAIDKRFVVADERLRKVEHTIWAATGVVAIIVLLVNIALKYL